MPLQQATKPVTLGTTMKIKLPIGQVVPNAKRGALHSWVNCDVRPVRLEGLLRGLVLQIVKAVLLVKSPQVLVQPSAQLVQQASHLQHQEQQSAKNARLGNLLISLLLQLAKPVPGAHMSLLQGPLAALHALLANHLQPQERLERLHAKNARLENFTMLLQHSAQLVQQANIQHH